MVCLLFVVVCCCLSYDVGDRCGSCVVGGSLFVAHCALKHVCCSVLCWCLSLLFVECCVIWCLLLCVVCKCCALFVVVC